jgi:hypothetical protein
MFSTARLATLTVGLLTLPLLVNAKPLHLPLTTEKMIAIFDEQYKDIRGYISTEESEFISRKGGSSVYGEILPESLQHILDDIKLTKKDVFWDLGNGLGKVCLQTAACTPATVYGVELAKTRVDLAQSVLKKIDQQYKLNLHKKCSFSYGNILDADLSKATVVYMCSTCYPEKLMMDIANKLAHNKKPLRVLTLKSLPEHPSFKLVKTYHEKMTWSSDSAVYLYELLLHKGNK